MNDGRRRKKKTAEELRSHRWFGPDDLRSFGHRSRARQMGYDEQDWAGKPVIAILNTWSDLNPCHVHFKERVEDIKRGIWQAGGFPVEIPAMSITETYMKPSPLLYRNFLAMEVEELLRSQPIDGAVLMGGCDKTTPGLLMGAISVNIPAIYFPAGPMLRGRWRADTLGSGSDVWKYWAERKAGQICDSDWEEIERGIARSPGHCMTMGTASTMTALAETLGMTLPGASSIPAVDSNHVRMAAQTGRRSVEMVWEDLKPSDILCRQAFENAVVADMALGGSTNAIIHLLALAGRAGVELELADFDRASREVPVMANVRPSGEYLMEDFYYAGGLTSLLWKIRRHLHLKCVTVSGEDLEGNIQDAPVHDSRVIRDRENPVAAEGGTAIIRGNLAPDGAVIKQSAADPHLLHHTGPAVVFDSYPEMLERLDDPELDIGPESVLVLRNAGPQGAPGMPEWGMLPLPRALLRKGVRDMVRISDARMSGTSYGTCVLHVCPEGFAGGPIALVQEGDLIELDVPGRSIHLRVDDSELARRRQAWSPPETKYPRGFLSLFIRHVTQANKGCDFDFLHTGSPLPEPEIF